MKLSRQMGRGISHGGSYEEKLAELQESYDKYLEYCLQSSDSIISDSSMDVSQKKAYLEALKADAELTETQYKQAAYDLQANYGLRDEENIYLTSPGMESGRDYEYSAAAQTAESYGMEETAAYEDYRPDNSLESGGHTEESYIPEAGESIGEDYESGGIDYDF